MSSEKDIFLEASARQINKSGAELLKKIQKENKKDKKDKKDSEWYRKQLEANLAYKRERLEWQKERSLLKDKLRRKREKEKGENAVKEPLSKIKTQTITDKDKDPTAYQKAMSGAASLAKGLASSGIAALKKRAEKKREESKKKKKQDAERASEDQKQRTKKAISQSSRLLPGSLPNETLGQRARRDPSFKKREIQRRGGTTTEQFSCWREEFLYELGEMRRNKKTKKLKNGEEKIVDVMKGKNVIDVSPTIEESKKREKVANAVLLATLAASAAQSPTDFVRTGHVESPGTALMQMWGKKRSEAERNLDSGRVSHPSRNIKRKKKLNTNIGEDWQKINKKDRTDGMSQAAVDEYRRQNKGSKLKTAVTGDPKPGSKDAQRRINYCHRSKGQQDMHNIDCSKDPDKPICKARRRWKC